MSDRCGQTLGNYRLLYLLGRGGFAEVYLGQHKRLNTQAAIKILHTTLDSNNKLHFEHEAQTIAALIHPHIIRVLDFDVKNGVPFLVMDYAPHGTLRTRHPRGTPLPLPVVASYIQQVASALQYAHDTKLIHRDVKPDNMLIGRHNDILLSDFGIATVVHNTASQNAQNFSGTINYTAPEQISSYPRPASDQYALAVVAYEWLCGTMPFHGTFEEIAAKHIMEEPPALRTWQPTIAPEVENVILKALAKDPKLRFPSVQEFAHALEKTAYAVHTTPTGEEKSITDHVELTQLSDRQVLPLANQRMKSTTSQRMESTILKTPVLQQEENRTPTALTLPAQRPPAPKAPISETRPVLEKSSKLHQRHPPHTTFRLRMKYTWQTLIQFLFIVVLMIATLVWWFVGPLVILK